MDHGPGKGALASVASADAIEDRALHFADDGKVPSNPDLPVVVLCRALGEGAAPDAVRGRLEANGWCGTWVWQVFPYHHYHPNAHEALAVASGHAELMLGGPEGQRVSAHAGDILVLPAGTGIARSKRARTSKCVEPTRQGKSNARRCALSIRTTVPYWSASAPCLFPV